MIITIYSLYNQFILSPTKATFRYNSNLGLKILYKSKLNYKEL